MNKSFDFNGVQAAEEITTGNKYVQPGVQRLTIVSLEDITASTGSSGFKVGFESDKGGVFTQNWFLLNAEDQPNSRVMESFQYLAKTFAGSELSGGVNSQSASALLVGRSKVVTVGGRRYTNEKDGKKFNNIAPELPFGGYDGERDPYIRGSWDASVESTTSSSEGSDGLPF